MYTNAGVNSQIHSKALGITLNREKSTSRYMNRWGVSFADAKIKMSTWHLTVHDSDDAPCTLSFDLVEGKYPLIIGLNFTQYSNTCNLQRPAFIILKRPTYIRELNFPIYFTDDTQGNQRLWMKIKTHEKSSVATMMANIIKRP